MLYTQIELTYGKRQVVVWIPVPAGKAKVGEVVTRTMYDYACAPTEDPEILEDWTITQVCTTLQEEDLPVNAKKVINFNRESISRISIGG